MDCLGEYLYEYKYQAVMNLEYRFDVLLYTDGADWEEHFSKFLAILSQLAYSCEEFSEE